MGAHCPCKAKDGFESRRIHSSSRKPKQPLSDKARAKLQLTSEQKFNKIPQWGSLVDNEGVL